MSEKGSIRTVPADTKVQFTYSASDPAGVTTAIQASQTVYQAASGESKGSLRE